MSPKDFPFANCNFRVKSIISHATGRCAFFNVKLHFFKLCSRESECIVKAPMWVIVEGQQVTLGTLTTSHSFLIRASNGSFGLPVILHHHLGLVLLLLPVGTFPDTMVAWSQSYSGWNISQSLVTYTCSINMHECWLDICATASSTRLITFMLPALSAF